MARRVFGLGLSIVVLVLAANQALSDGPAVSPAQVRLKKDVAFLADDAQEGRAPGTKGIEASADYIAASFRESGLKLAPGLDSYFQTFSIRGNPALVEPPTLAFSGPGGDAIKLEPGRVQPLAVGGSATFDAVPVVFAGYGISARDDAKKLNYDDYAGMDIRGKAVLILRQEPQRNDEKSPFDGKERSEYSSFTHKISNAYKEGAAVVLVVNDKVSLNNGGNDELIKFTEVGSNENSPVPVVMLSRFDADQLLAKAGQPRLETLEAEIDRDLKPRSRLLGGWTASGSVKISRKGTPTRNVVGILEGVGPLAGETLVVGAHYDHLGRGGPTSGSLAIFSHDIHNGADDNASGTALVMELARRLGKLAEPLPRRVVFMTFSGEEEGLLGSRHYVEHPLIPLDQTVMMVNFDMVGRLNAKSELTIMGTGSASGLEDLVDTIGTAAGLKVRKVKGISDGFGGSDHQSFYRKNVPVLFPFTGAHLDYHRPSDDTDRINFDGMSRLADFGETLVLDLARRASRPAFVKLVEPLADPHGGGAVDPGRIGVGAYLGTMPDYGAEEKGIKLSGVREGGPADKAGIKGGDVIISFAGKPISGIQDYTDSLRRSKPGDKVVIIVNREGKEVTLSVTLGTKPTQ